MMEITMSLLVLLALKHEKAAELGNAFLLHALQEPTSICSKNSKRVVTAAHCSAAGHFSVGLPIKPFIIG